MRDADDGRAVGAAAVGREEAGGDEGVHERAFLGGRSQPLERRRFARRQFPDRRQGDQLAEDRGKRGLHRLGKRREHLAGAGGQRFLDPAQLPVGRERQPAVFPAPLVKLIQREFQQGQAVGAVGRLQQHVVQPGIGLGLDLERQPGGHRRLTNDLPNVGGGRRTEVILPNPVLETHQLGDLAAAPVEIAPQRGDHPHFFVVLDKGGNRIKEPNPLLRNDIDTEELFELIDDQGEPRFRLRLGPGAAPAHREPPAKALP